MVKKRTKFWTFMDFLMQTGLETWIKEDLQVGMCLTVGLMEPNLGSLLVVPTNKNLK